MGQPRVRRIDARVGVNTAIVPSRPLRMVLAGEPRPNRPEHLLVTYWSRRPRLGGNSSSKNQAGHVVFELIIDNPYMRLYFHEDAGIVHHEIRKPLEGKVFQETLTRGAELLESKRAAKWLSDNRGHLGLSEADEAWGRTVWFPRVKAAGWRHWAIVKPQSAIGALNMSRLSQNYTILGVNARVFTSFDEAFEWLKAC